LVERDIDERGGLVKRENSFFFDPLAFP